MAHLAKSVLRVDDEAELLEPRRGDVRAPGFGGAMAHGRACAGVRPKPRR